MAATTAPPQRQNKPAALPPGRAGMELRKFVAPTRSQCLSLIRSEMGDQAVILATRTIQQRWFLGLLKRDQVEVTAGRGLRRMPRRPGGGSSPQVRNQVGLDRAASGVAPGGELLNSPAAMRAICMGVTTEIDSLKQTMRDLVDQFRNSQAPDIPKPFLKLYATLREQQVDETAIREIILAAARVAAAGPGACNPRKLVCAEIEKRLKTSGPVRRRAQAQRPHVVALIGPTGVGKTTTVAKLAANLKLREGCKVGLITIDTYRIAAIDQLKKYAEIISAPLLVVSSPAEIRRAIKQMADHDFILIDTAGRSPRDAVKLEELRAFLEAARPDEVHLVLSTVCGMKSTALALERFSGVRADRLIFTKLDEAAAIGVVVNVVGLTQLPLSYLTNGQDVPNDIDVAQGHKLALLATDSQARVTTTP